MLESRIIKQEDSRCILRRIEAVVYKKCLIYLNFFFEILAFENNDYRVKRAAPNETRKPGNSAPEYYSKYIDEKIRYVELALIADNSIVSLG